MASEVFAAEFCFLRRTGSQAAMSACAARRCAGAFDIGLIRRAAGAAAHFAPYCIHFFYYTAIYYIICIIIRKSVLVEISNKVCNTYYVQLRTIIDHNIPTSQIFVNWLPAIKISNCTLHWSRQSNMFYTETEQGYNF